MKGLFINSAVQNKIFYIVTLCAFAAFLLLTTVLFGNFNNDPAVMGVAILVPYLSVLIIPVILFEGVGKKTERMLKCGFLKYTLTSGVSKIKYAVSETILNLIYAAISVVLCIIIFWVAEALAPGYTPPAADYIRIIILFNLFMGAIISIANTFVLFTKNEEIAALITGCILAFFVAIILGIQEIKGEHLVITVDTTFTVIVSAACLVLYAISTVVMMLRLQRYSG